MNNARKERLMREASGPLTTLRVVAFYAIVLVTVAVVTEINPPETQVARANTGAPR
jgi:hypothetical protein